MDKSGRYGSASDVVRAGLRLLGEEAWRAEVRTRIAGGIAAAQAGKWIDGDEAIGQVREDLSEVSGLRFWPVRDYLVVYRTVEGRVEVLRIPHGRRHVERGLGDHRAGP